MKIYMLDVTGCEKEELGGYDKPIPCRLSNWKTDLDVMEERIDSAVIKVWRKQGLGFLYKKDKRGIPVSVIRCAPIGFKLKTLPIGATITVVEEE